MGFASDGKSIRGRDKCSSKNEFVYFFAARLCAMLHEQGCTETIVWESCVQERVRSWKNCYITLASHARPVKTLRAVNAKMSAFFTVSAIAAAFASSSRRAASFFSARQIYDRSMSDSFRAWPAGTPVCGIDTEKLTRHQLCTNKLKGRATCER